MKSFITILIIAVTLFSCAQKITSSAPTTVANVVKPPADIINDPGAKMESTAVTEGKNIYTTKCARCHGPKKVDDWTVQEWIPIIDRMAPKARLDASEKANVTAYVNYYAKSSN